LCGGVVLVLVCLLVFLVLLIMCLFLGCRLVSVVSLVVALLEELATQIVIWGHRVMLML
jgi:hypothetical protein